MIRVLLLVLACSALRQLAASKGPRPLPVLDNSVDTLVCGYWHCNTNTSRQNITAACSRSRTVVVVDSFPCFAAAIERAQYQPIDLSSRSGGEVVFCRNVLRLLGKLGYTYVATTNGAVAEQCVLMGRAKGIEHLMITHGGWRQLAGTETIQRAYRIRPPFREECLMSLHFFGTASPVMLWPGDLKYYISIWPSTYNSYALIEKPPNCPTFKNYQHVPLPPYGVVFGKYKSMPVKVNHTDPFFRNATLWRALRQKVHLVVLDCSDALAEILQWGPDYKQELTCWKDSPLSKTISYHNLMMGAAFFLGLGDTFHSPTPVEALACRTPMIMPPYQHSMFPSHAGKREYYPVSSPQDVLDAVSRVLADCKVELEVVKGGKTHKRNSCFDNPSAMDDLLSDRRMCDRLLQLVNSRMIMCNHKPNVTRQVQCEPCGQQQQQQQQQQQEQGQGQMSTAEVGMLPAA